MVEDFLSFSVLDEQSDSSTAARAPACTGHQTNLDVRKGISMQSL
jgi:hypothetical protein